MDSEKIPKIALVVPPNHQSDEVEENEYCNRKRVPLRYTDSRGDIGEEGSCESFLLKMKDDSFAKSFGMRERGWVWNEDTLVVETSASSFDGHGG